MVENDNEKEKIAKEGLINSQDGDEQSENRVCSDLALQNIVNDAKEEKSDYSEFSVKSESKDEKVESEPSKPETTDKEISIGIKESKDEKVESEQSKPECEFISKTEFDDFRVDVNKRSIEMCKQVDKLISELDKLRSEVVKLSVMEDYIKKADFENVIRELKSSFDSLAEENLFLRQVVENKIDTSKLLRIREEQEKLSSKLDLILEEIGFGEEMNIGKIPPSILEMVYQTTLDDVISELWKNLGPYESEKVIMKVLEEVRLNTSGSELFKFDGKRLCAKYVARTIEQRLISAKQIHITYNEILNKLLDHIPGHKAKNFNAMIKIKSQEYAVDKELLESYKEEIEIKFRDIVKEKIKEDERISEILELRKSIEESNKLQKELKNELTILKEEIAKVKEIKEKKEMQVCLEKKEESDNLEKEMKIETEVISANVTSKELKNSGFSGTVVICDEPEDKKIKEVLPEGLEEGSDEERVYSAIQKKGSSIPKILKKLSYELSEDSVERILATLEERGFVKAWTKGKSRLYFKSKDYNERMDEEM
ncbi:MAG: hypothetical protein QXT63_00095 [Thermoplasmata archaeon]